MPCCTYYTDLLSTVQDNSKLCVAHFCLCTMSSTTPQRPVNLDKIKSALSTLTPDQKDAVCWPYGRMVNHSSEHCMHKHTNSTQYHHVNHAQAETYPQHENVSCRWRCCLALNLLMCWCVTILLCCVCGLCASWSLKCLTTSTKPCQTLKWLVQVCSLTTCNKQHNLQCKSCAHLSHEIKHSLCNDLVVHSLTLHTFRYAFKQ